MFDTVIAGGGLCGLALASGLKGRLALFEARMRLGGRILSVQCGGQRVDLGPTWFWPEMQPRMSRMVSELGLESFPQHESGTVLHLKDAENEPSRIRFEDLHGGAYRLVGGMMSLVEALAASMPDDTVRLGRELVAARDRIDHVELVFRSGDGAEIVHCRQAVLAIPPRLLAEKVVFEPGLDERTLAAMRDTQTWMAAQAKAVVGYETPFWRMNGDSGNAFVSHAQAVLGEIFDACDEKGHAALGGFFSLSSGFRASVDPESMKLLISSQMTQLFGIQAGTGETLIQDWAKEPYTCSRLDLSPAGGHPEYGDQSLCLPLWEGKLFLGGSETAGYGGGYMEGALESAARIRQSLYAGELVDG